ncbi:MAG: DNA-binding protein [Chlorobiaceae bacterium]|nr:DNA-binding protein [Chlorobiaceae bacterium]
MKYSEAALGRTFIIRLEDGEIFHEEIERFAREKGIGRAFLNVVGGADRGSRLVVGPEQSRALPVNPMVHELYDAHEIVGTGTLFPDDEGNPVVHLHMTCGREENSVTGCVRSGVKVWHVMEVILVELLNATARRLPESATGFKLLQP